MLQKYLPSIPEAQHLEKSPRNSMKRNKKILFFFFLVLEYNTTNQ